MVLDSIDRSYLITAITRACQYFYAYTFSNVPGNAAGLPTGAYFAFYHNVQAPGDEGVVLVSIGYCEYSPFYRLNCILRQGWTGCETHRC